ncbi:MAG: 3-hydroxyacyl-CoA dehydrogenase family protein [Chloroflexi bacterium]|nr:3-hydroxyacyl-CoA dehydrogenase family protein [Chloroflexota bacterium]
MAGIERIAVVGAGLMGHAIALDFALAGFRVKMQDKNDASVERGFEMVRSDFDRMVKLKTTTREKANAALKKMSGHTNLSEAVGDADVVVEAVFEDLKIKQQMFKRLDAAAPKGAILASNTSSFMPSQLYTMTSRPDKVLVAHYFNPAHLIPLVELVRSPETSDATVETMRGLYEGMGKKPIVVEKEVIGFIVNRMQIALQREAFWLLDNGVASAEDIDTGLKSSAGRRWAVAGPFEVMDLAGLDTLVDASKAMLPHISNSREVSKSLTDAVEQGNLGTKTGKGFHTWTPESVDAVKQRIAEALVELERWSKKDAKE